MDGLRAVACFVVKRAIFDMQTNGVGGSWQTAKQTHRDYLKAVVWLASKRASIYFDAAGVEQEEVLYAISWADYATNILSGPKVYEQLTFTERKVLSISLDKLGRRFGGKHV